MVATARAHRSAVAAGSKAAPILLYERLRGDLLVPQARLGGGNTLPPSVPEERVVSGLGIERWQLLAQVPADTASLYQAL